jgi:hypothetical protein
MTKTDIKINAILTLVSIIFSGTLVLGFTLWDRYNDCHDALTQKISDVAALQGKYDESQTDYRKLKTEYDNLQTDYISLQVQFGKEKSERERWQRAYLELQAAKKIEFEHGLKIENVSNLDKLYITGTIQNVSTEHMGKVKILIATYDDNRALMDTSSHELTNLASGEKQQWSVYVGPNYKYFDYYAFGNRKYD